MDATNSGLTPATLDRAAGYRLLCRPSVRLHHEVAHGDPERRVRSGRRSIESLALDFHGWRRRALW